MKIKYVFNFLEITLIVLMTSCSGNSDKKVKKKTSLQTQAINRVDTVTIPDSAWYFEKVIGQTLYFKNNKTFKTNLFDLHYIGQLKAKHKAPYLILSGRNCNECDENISIFIHSPSDGPMKNEAEQITYSYPGKEFDYATNKLIFESRMFYGDCIVNTNECIVWVQKKLNDNGVFKNSTLTVEVNNDKLKESIESKDSITLKKLFLKCKELPGINVTSEP
jgi:hypothetical protein